jgi:hypothetical protein
MVIAGAAPWPRDRLDWSGPFDIVEHTVDELTRELAVEVWVDRRAWAFPKQEVQLESATALAGYMLYVARDA